MDIGQAIPIMHNRGKLGVYILRCHNLRYYIGSTDDLDRRFYEHQQGKVKSTKLLLPVILAFFQPCSSLADARKLEYKLKAKKSRVILDRIIKDGCIQFEY